MKTKLSSSRVVLLLVVAGTFIGGSAHAQDSTHWQRDMVLGTDSGSSSSSSGGSGGNLITGLLGLPFKIIGGIFGGVGKMAEKRKERRHEEAHTANHQGVEFSRQDNWPEANRCYKVAASKNPGDATIQQNYAQSQTRVAQLNGQAAFKKGDYRSAVKYFQEAVRKNPFAANAWAYNGDLVMAQAKLKYQLAEEESTRVAAAAAAREAKEAGKRQQAEGSLIAHGTSTRRGAFGSNESNVKVTEKAKGEEGQDTRADRQLKAAPGNTGERTFDGRDPGKADGSLTFHSGGGAMSMPTVPKDLGRRNPEAMKRVTKYQDQWKAGKAQQEAAAKEMAAIKEARKQPNVNSGDLDVREGKAVDKMTGAKSQMATAVTNTKEEIRKFNVTTLE